MAASTQAPVCCGNVWAKLLLHDPGQQRRIAIGVAGIILNQLCGVCGPLIFGYLAFDDRRSEGIAQDVAVESRNGVGRMIAVHDATPVNGQDGRAQAPMPTLAGDYTIRRVVSASFPLTSRIGADQDALPASSRLCVSWVFSSATSFSARRVLMPTIGFCANSAGWPVKISKTVQLFGSSIRSA